MPKPEAVKKIIRSVMVGRKDVWNINYKKSLINTNQRASRIAASDKLPAIKHTL
jgi:hypothetical protein